MSTAKIQAPELADVRIDDPGWSASVADLSALCADALEAVFAAVDAQPGEVAFLFTDDAAVRALNAAYRGQDKPTNVLSFPADPESLPPGAPHFLGDVALARETVLAEARDQGKSPRAHAAHLIVHGTLHLMGYEHDAPDAAAAMEDLERRILARLGIADPYAVTGDAA